MQKLALICLALLLPLLSPLAELRAGAPLAIDSTLNGPRLGLHLDVLEDPSGTLDINAINMGGPGVCFVPAGRDYPSYGYSSSIYWARLKTRNGEKSPVWWLLQLDTPHMDLIELYAPDPSGGYSVRRFGDTLPFSQRGIEYRTFVLPILEPPGENTYYMRFKTEGSMDLHLRAWSPMAFVAMVNRELPVLWVFYSFLFIMVCYNLYLLFSIRRTSYLYFSLFIGSYLFLQMVLDGSSYQYLWPGFPWWANHSLPAAMFCCLLFATLHAISFLGTRRITPRLHRLMTALAAMNSAGIALSLLLPMHLILLIAIYATFINIIIHFLTAVFCAYRGYSPARYYYAGWCLFFAGGLAHIIWTFGMLPSMLITVRGIMVGATLMIVSFSLGLGESLRMVKAEKERLVKELKNSEEKYRGLVENLNDVIFSLDNEGRFTYISSAIRNISSDYGPEDIVGKSFVDFIHPDDLQSVMESRARTLNGAYEPLEYRLQDRDGRAVHIRTSSRPVYDGGELVGITGIITDITEQKRARDELKASLAEKDVLLKEIHHRVKNNMQIIYSLLNLQMDGMDDERQKAALLDCQGRIYSMALVHERIYKSESFERVDFAGYVEALANVLLRSQIGVHINIRLEMRLDSIQIPLAKAVPCGLILNELITNGIRHAFHDKEDGILRISLQRDEGNIILKVEDNGIGLPDGISPGSQGTLGLRLVQLLAEQINGRLEISSNNGACLKVIFPADF